MAMSKRSFRTKQAIEAFESCEACSTLPADKKSEVQAELNKARRRKEQQDAEVPHDTDILFSTFINPVHQYDGSFLLFFWYNWLCSFYVYLCFY